MGPCGTQEGTGPSECDEKRLQDLEQGYSKSDVTCNGILGELRDKSIHSLAQCVLVNAQDLLFFLHFL